MTCVNGSLSALVHVSVENESFTTADLRLCFRICRLLVFSSSGSYFMSLKMRLPQGSDHLIFMGGGWKRQVKFYRTYCIIYK